MKLTLDWKGAVPYFILIDLFGKFIVFVDYIFSSTFSANHKLKIMNKHNVRRFYGKSRARYASKYVQFSEATAADTSWSADDIDVVILPPDDNQLS